MPVRKTIAEKDGIYFITITCARWLPLFKTINGYDIVYNWFDHLKQNLHYITGYVIMPGHVHAVIAFSNAGKSINLIVGNGKRFMAYAIVNRLAQQGETGLLEQMKAWVNNTDKQRNKHYEVFEPSFDWKPAWRQTGNAERINF
jgi:hypothetical protein